MSFHLLFLTCGTTLKYMCNSASLLTCNCVFYYLCNICCRMMAVHIYVVCNTWLHNSNRFIVVCINILFSKYFSHAGLHLFLHTIGCISVCLVRLCVIYRVFQKKTEASTLVTMAGMLQFWHVVVFIKLKMTSCLLILIIDY